MCTASWRFIQARPNGGERVDKLEGPLRDFGVVASKEGLSSFHDGFSSLHKRERRARGGDRAKGCEERRLNYVPRDWQVLDPGRKGCLKCTPLSSVKGLEEPRFRSRHESLVPFELMGNARSLNKFLETL